MAKRVTEPWYQPPVEERCALCGRVVPGDQRDKHHLIPKSEGGKETAVLHRICHRQIHALFTESELAHDYATIDALMTNDSIRRFVKWIRTKPPGFYERTRRRQTVGGEKVTWTPRTGRPQSPLS